MYTAEIKDNRLFNVYNLSKCNDNPILENSLELSEDQFFEIRDKGNFFDWKLEGSNFIYDPLPVEELPIQGLSVQQTATNPSMTIPKSIL